MAGVRIGGIAMIPSTLVIPYRRFFFGPGDWELATLPSKATVLSEQTGSQVASPDGTQIAFSGASSDLYIVNTDGSGETLLDNTLTSAAISWHPDGLLILYRVGTNVRTIEPDGSNLTTVATVANLQQPLYNRDGTLIAYIVASDPAELWVMNADGTGATMLAQAPGTGADGVLDVFSWARTTDTLVFQMSDGIGGGPLWTIEADGSGLTQVTTGSLSCDRWAWAPDDSVIIAVGDNGDTIYSVDPGGGGETSLGLTLGNTAADGPEVWGNRIYYQGGTNLANLMSAALDGSDVVKEDGDDLATFDCSLTSGWS